MKKHIPNLLTSLNVFSGCVASVMALNGEYFWVVFWVFLAAVFDFFDGFMARLLKAYSPLGKELDSLADMISFGLAPSLLLFHYLSTYAVDFTPISVVNQYFPYFAFLLAIFSALRLAKFNIDERQTSTFIGLPTPANALFWISVCYALGVKYETGSPLITSVLLILVVAFSLLMISEVPMFSLKAKDMKWKGNELRYLLIATIIILFVFVQILAFAIGIALYALVSLLMYKKAQ